MFEDAITFSFWQEKKFRVSTDNRNVPLVTTLEVSPFRRKGNVRFLVNLPQWSGLWGFSTARRAVVFSAASHHAIFLQRQPSGHFLCDLNGTFHASNDTGGVPGLIQ